MTTLRAVPADPLPDHEDNPPAVRQGADSLRAKVESIRRVLAQPCALPGARQRAREDLAALAAEALSLRGLL